MPFPENAAPDAPPTELDKLQVAMAVQVARRIVDADGVLDLSEVQLLSEAFPNQWMQRCGFVDQAGQLTPAVEAFAARAESELANRLNLPQKLELITLFHNTCMVDGEMHQLELEVLTEAARRLHIPRGRFRQHLAGLRAGPESVPPVQGEH